MEYCNLTDKELRIAVMKKFSKLQEDSERQYSDFRNKMNQQKEYFTKHIELLKKKDTEILELKNALESIENRAEQAEERISELGDRNLETIQVQKREN